jgi:hypothetical protein
VGRRRLSAYEFAARLGFFLRDSLPDDELIRAAQDGRLDTDVGVTAEVDRLLAKPEVRANVSSMFLRLFQTDRLFGTSKAPSIKEFTPALAASLFESTRLFFDDFLWKSGAKLPELMTTRKVFVDKILAPIYGLPARAGTKFEAVTLAEGQRGGVLTQAALMTIEAKPDESSAVHRGVFIVRELLCMHPPSPVADDLALGDVFRKQAPTERGQAEKRAGVPRCSQCHTFLDPMGVPFEHYDTLGRYRTTIRTPEGNVPVDASWDLSVFDLKGRVKNGIELSAVLGGSPLVQACMARQFVSYAAGQFVESNDACGLPELTRKFVNSGADFLQLLRVVAIWPGLRERNEGVTP